LGGPSDTDGRVLEDELGVALGRVGSNEVKLALRELDKNLLATARAENELAD